MNPLFVRMNSFYAVSCNPSAFTVELQDDLVFFFHNFVFLLFTYPLRALELRHSLLHCLTILLVLPRSVSCLVNDILRSHLVLSFLLLTCFVTVLIYPGLSCFALTSLLLLRILIVFIQLEFCVIQMSFIITLVLVVSRSLIFKL